MKNNIVFFVVDSARSYSTGGLDDRDKLEIMESFANESVFFSNVISSAPSSIMSASAMLTSLPAYYIARNYNDFKYDDKIFTSLPRLLEAEGYEIKSVMNARETREKFDSLLPHVRKKYWVNGLQHDQIRWSNEKVTEVLENFLAGRTSTKPLFLWVWYNIRLDPTTSQEVERGINVLKKHKVWENTVFVLCSDHGYIDPRRGYTPEKLKKMGLTHDLVMSEDNIRIPLYMRFPNSPVAQIDVPVSTLDFMPTILDYLGMSYPHNALTKMYGLSLLPLFQDRQPTPEEFLIRKFRADARFFGQSDRCTIIRGVRYKYLTRPDQGIEEFYDLENEPREWEECNLIEDAAFYNLVEEYRDAFQRTEDEAIQFQTRFMIEKLRETVQNALEKSTGRIVVVGLGQPYYLDIISAILPEVFDDSPLDLVVDRHISNRMEKQTVYQQVYTYQLCKDGQMIGVDIAKLSTRAYSIKLTLIDTRNKQVYHQHSEALRPYIRAKVELNIDPNMKPISRDAAKSSPYLLIRTVYGKRSYYLRYPKIFFRHLFLGIKSLRRKFLSLE